MDNRIVIKSMIIENKSLRQIALAINKNVTSISRELKRNRTFHQGHLFFFFLHCCFSSDIQAEIIKMLSTYKKHSVNQLTNTTKRFDDTKISYREIIIILHKKTTIERGVMTNRSLLLLVIKALDIVAIPRKIVKAIRSTFTMVL